MYYLYRLLSIAIIFMAVILLENMFAQQFEPMYNTSGENKLQGGDIDLFEESMRASQIVNPKIDIDYYKQAIANIIEVCEKSNIATALPEDKIKILANTIHGDFGINTPDKPSHLTGPEYGMIDFVIDNKEGNCLGLVVLYLIISGKLGIPLSAETVSSHIILRYDDGVDCFYVETTTGGSVHRNLDHLNSIIKGKVKIGGRDLYPLNKKQIIAELLYNVGVFLSRRADNDKAINCYKMAIDYNNNHDDAYRAWGDLLFAKDDFLGAITMFQTAIKLNPKNDAAYTNMGLAFNNLESFDKAIDAFERAIDLDPNNAYAYLNWGISLVCISNNNEARLKLNRARQLDPSLEENIQRLLKMIE